MTKGTCSVDGCEAATHARGWCKKHYQRWSTHGDPLKLGYLRTHGQTDSLLHQRWASMRHRCSPAGQARHPTYVGVRSDERWGTFEGFLANPPTVSDGHEYEPGMVLARVADRGDYSPENARWRTKSENTREMMEGKMRRLADGRFASDVARTNGITPQRLSARLRCGWSLERATTESPFQAKINYRNLR